MNNILNNIKARNTNKRINITGILQQNSKNIMFIKNPNVIKPVTNNIKIFLILIIVIFDSINTCL